MAENWRGINDSARRLSRSLRSVGKFGAARKFRGFEFRSTGTSGFRVGLGFIGFRSTFRGLGLGISGFGVSSPFRVAGGEFRG